MSHSKDRQPLAESLSRDDLIQRVEELEKEQTRLKRQLSGVGGSSNPNLDVVVFRRGLNKLFLCLFGPAMMLYVVIAGAAMATRQSAGQTPMIGPLPLVDFGGIGTSHPGIGFGVFTFGGLSVGIFAFGGASIGLMAIGGGAFGVVAVGGGSVGVIALGGGAVGYIAIGGTAVGRYALGQRAYGKAAFGLNRQDGEAVAFFGRFAPWLRKAFIEGICHRCGYDLTGNTSGICPECGMRIAEDSPETSRYG